MKINITITDINAVLGILFGLSALILAIINYRRDNPRVIVNLAWDMSMIEVGGGPQDTNKLHGAITVTNTGRRPIYLSHVSLKLPNKEYLLLKEGITGQKLSEGDPPRTFTVSHDQIIRKIGNRLKKQPDMWKSIRAQVSDSAGKIYLSKPVKKCPEWAKQSICVISLIFLCGCAVNSQFANTPLYHASNDELIEKCRLGNEATQEYPDLAKLSPSEIKIAIPRLSENEKGALMKMIEGEMARRIYNERVGQAGGVNVGPSVLGGGFNFDLGRGIQSGLGALPGIMHPPALQNGNYHANVRYTNFSTSHIANYTLVVTVEYNSVTAIYFEDGGYVHTGLNNEGYTWSGGSLIGNSTTVTLYYQNGSTAQFNINIKLQ